MRAQAAGAAQSGVLGTSRVSQLSEGSRTAGREASYSQARGRAAGRQTKAPEQPPQFASVVLAQASLGAMEGAIG